MSSNLTRGKAALKEAGLPLETVFTDPDKVMVLPGISTKIMEALKQEALDQGHIMKHPLAKRVLQMAVMLNDRFIISGENVEGIDPLVLEVFFRFNLKNFI
jgi:hypothetical protein